MNNPLISVVIPTYKRSPEMISRSINSVTNQTYQHIEVIVVDDSPESYSHREKVKCYVNALSDSRIKYIQHDQNMGACAARNTGIKHSRGSYLAFLDDDDEWMLDKLEKQIKQFSSDKIGLVYCKAKVVDQIKKETRDANHVILRKGYVFDELMKNNFVGSTSFVLIRTDVIEEVGNFEEEIKSNQDWELFLRISKKYQISFVDDYLVRYYIHDGERITTNIEKKIQGLKFLINQYDDYLSKNLNIKSYWYIKMVSIYLKSGQKKNALNSAYRAFKYSPSEVVRNAIRFISFSTDK